MSLPGRNQGVRGPHLFPGFWGTWFLVLSASGGRSSRGVWPLSHIFEASSVSSLSRLSLGKLSAFMASRDSVGATLLIQITSPL